MITSVQTHLRPWEPHRPGAGRMEQRAVPEHGRENCPSLVLVPGPCTLLGGGGMDFGGTEDKGDALLSR